MVSIVVSSSDTSSLKSLHLSGGEVVNRAFASLEALETSRSSGSFDNEDR